MVILQYISARFRLVTVLLFAFILDGCIETVSQSAYQTRELKLIQKKALGARRVSYPRGALKQPLVMQVIRNAHPVIKARINDQFEVNLLVDTGAARTHLPLDLLKNTTDGLASVDSICFENDLCFHDVRVRFRESPYTQTGKNTYNGLLGSDLLQYFPFTLDYEKHQFLFDHPVTKQAPHTVAFQMHRTFRPFTEVAIGKVQLPVTLLDTGATFTRMLGPDIDNKSVSSVYVANEMAFSIRGYQLTRLYEMQSVCVTDVCMDSLPVQLGNWRAIGASFFRNFLTTFDYSQNKLFLRPYSTRSNSGMPAFPFRGMQVSMLNPEEIAWVKKRSPAEQAGIQQGDRLLALNHRSVADLGYFGVNQMLGSGSVIKLSYMTAAGENRQLNLTAN